MRPTIIENGTGLVFSGGGGKGAYQIGAWKAMRQLGIDKQITAVSGTSVGGLNAALFAEGDFAKSELLWRNISPSQFLDPSILREPSQDFTQNLARDAVSLQMLTSVATIFTHGLTTAAQLPAFIKPIGDAYRFLMEKSALFSREGLQKILRSDVDLNAVSNSKIPCFITVVKLPGISTKYHEVNFRLCVRYFNMQHKIPEHIENYLLATSAIPLGVYPAVRIRGFYYIDGGTLDVLERVIGISDEDIFHRLMLPALDPLLRPHEKSDDNVPVRPLYENGCRKIIAVHCDAGRRIDRSRYPGCSFTEIIPSRDLGGFFDGALDFSPEGAAKRMELGYRDAMAVFRSADYLCEKYL